MANIFNLALNFSCILFVLLDLVSGQKLPAVRPIIHVIPNCPPSVNVNTTVVMKADVPVLAEVHCRHQRIFNMQEINSVTHSLYATFSDINDPGVCAFKKKNKANIYVLPINVLWGDGEGGVLKFWRRMIITCGFDSHSRNTSSSKQISDLELPILENQQNQGVDTDVQFEVYLLDVLGNPVDGLPVGRKTQLKATMTPANGEVGFRVTSCLAIGIALEKNATYSILRGGCGDGKVFPKSSGFHSSGFDAFSPYFEAFRLMGSNLVAFACNFTICHSNCDGSSCTVEPLLRRRRSVEEGTNGSRKRKPQYTTYSSIVKVSSDAPELMSELPESVPVLSGQHGGLGRDIQCGQVEITLVVFLVIVTVLLTCCLSCVTSSVWGRYKQEGYHQFMH